MIPEPPDLRPPLLASVYPSTEAVDFLLSDVPPMPRPGRVLLTTPAFFKIQYVINPHMEGHIGTVDQAEASRQWHRLREAYDRLGFSVEVVAGVDGLPDMVFCANQTLPYCTPDGATGVVLSRMHAPQRRGEVPHFASFFEKHPYRMHRPPAPEAAAFEGMGDALWHPGRFLLWGGHGHRTDPAVYPSLAAALGVRVLLLELADPDFYHLDTCLSVLDEETALYVPAAFRAEGLGLLRHFFPRLLEVPEDEARALLACNAHCPDGTHILIQAGCPRTCRLLEQAGFVPVELDTSEFLKAGGSVFCMKQMWW